MSNYTEEIFLTNRYETEIRLVTESFTETLPFNSKFYPHNFIGFEFYNDAMEVVVPTAGSLKIDAILATMPSYEIVVDNGEVDLSAVTSQPSFSGLPIAIKATISGVVGVGVTKYKLILDQKA